MTKYEMTLYLKQILENRWDMLKVWDQDPILLQISEYVVFLEISTQDSRLISMHKWEIHEFCAEI